MKTVNKHHLSCWQRNCPALNVRWHSANVQFLMAWILPAHGLEQVLFETQSAVSHWTRKRSLWFFGGVFYALPHNLCFLILNPHLTAPTKTISLLGKLQSITFPQHGTIRLILARVAPNLAASEQWVQCVESYQSEASSLFGRQRGSATNVCLPGWLISSGRAATLTDWAAWVLPQIC